MIDVSARVNELSQHDGIWDCVVIVYYFRARRVRGVLLWNVWDKVELARTLISEGHKFTVAELDTAIPT